MDAEEPQLRALASYFHGQGGMLVAAELGGSIVGMAATRPLPEAPGTWEICKVYVDATQRGTGLAHRLLDTVEAAARAGGAQTLRLWSDSRFDRAHRFYERRGFVRDGPLRVLNDLSNTIEFAYARPFAGVQVMRLDAAGAASAQSALTEILRACIDDGASVSYLPPADPAVLHPFWRRIAAEVAAGTRILLVAWAEGALAGTVSLDCATPPNQPHRAEVQKLLVRPTLRRRGVAAALMHAAEAAARQAGRTLLTLDTRAGDAGEAVYRAAGWIEAGRIPRYALNADGTYCDTVLFWKSL